MTIFVGDFKFSSEKNIILLKLEGNDFEQLKTLPIGTKTVALYPKNLVSEDEVVEFVDKCKCRIEKQKPDA